MKKSVYSLVLMDDVVKAVDEQAYRLGTSRSNLINQILAQHLSCITPEMRMKDIFDSVSELISSTLQIQQQHSASLMTMKTALEYKYRPTINYKVELKRIPDEFMGNIRVQIRTQSPALIGLFNSFFAYRVRMEKLYLAQKGADNYVFSIGNGIFSRSLINSSLSDEQAGEAIGEYITDLNRAVKVYFSSPENFAENIPALEKEYRKMLEKYII
ncbi:MAG: hypothetical protein J6I55_02835 [Ruminococcus sp.]|nr:hypothetical protein [Ruminococcus sp.]